MPAFWRYAQARLNTHRRDMAYRHFVADALRIVSENTAKAAGSGSYMSIRLADILNPKPADERTADEIICAIRNKL